MSRPAPRISIVIPAYNAAPFIEKTLETVAAQTFRDFELLVVDDGSKDGTHEVVERFLRDRSLAGACLRQENKKIAAARNHGNRASSGELVAFLDHDDLWLPSKLATCVAALDARPEIGLVCHAEEILSEGRVVRVARYGPWVEGMYERLLFKGNALSPSAVVVRRAHLQEVGGFRENPEFNTVEDYDLWMRLARVCRFQFLDEVLGRYVLVPAAASNRVVYHHDNAETLLRDHFRALYGDAPGPLARLRMRRRLSAVYRSALGALMSKRESPDLQGRYARRMLGAFPLDAKNLVRAAQWALGRGR
ncbi:MAG TPA: glycosyltransferase [Elusimicrobiota bacterium]|nr:glycosyltransferase [Elusimicrobiota bacterium]